MGKNKEKITALNEIELFMNPNVSSLFIKIKIINMGY